MATISNATLEIIATLNPNDHHYDVIVQTKISYSAAEYAAIKSGTIKCKVKCAIWGKDYGQFHWLNPDDLIHEIGYRDFTHPESRENAVTFKTTLPKGWLNEDIGQDEIHFKGLSGLPNQ
ncbi:MAG: hypothetical protein IPN26_09050 [Bacteroidetes bacterium]|nr:hypothetical protein [Bacteroidota bacterium]